MQDRPFPGGDATFPLAPTVWGTLWPWPSLMCWQVFDLHKCRGCFLAPQQALGSYTCYSSFQGSSDSLPGRWHPRSLWEGAFGAERPPAQPSLLRGNVSTPTTSIPLQQATRTGNNSSSLATDLWLNHPLLVADLPWLTYPL